MSWTLARAKDHLSEVVRQAISLGPQTISVRGREAAVVVSKTDYERLRDPATPKAFKDYLLSIPSLEGVDLTRDQSVARDIDF